jgi:HlyD family secretion protein
VSESDVGTAKLGEKATFTVEAYPGRTFTGHVAQVREAPITVQNVVTYDVVISVENDDLALLPGMTANTRIVTDERADVLRVPVKALRFAPHGLRRSEAGTTVAVLRGDEVERVPVVTGLSDGTFTEVVDGKLAPGDRVVVDEVGAAAGGAPHTPPPGAPPVHRGGLHL